MTLAEHYDEECLRVSVTYGVPIEDIRNPNRTKRASKAKTLVAFAMRKHSPDSLAAIANLMGITHTSVLRRLKDSESDTKQWLRRMMSHEEVASAKEHEAKERARIEAERAQLDEAASKVAVLGMQADVVERAMADKDEWKRRWGLAVHKARRSDDPDHTLRMHLKDLFPLTHQTPSALCA